MSDDEEMIGYLRGALGYALSGDVSEQCLFLLLGCGSNGKSVLLETILGLMGDYAMKAESHLLTSAGRTQHPTAKADLDGRRFVAISEPSGGRFDEALVKEATGGDSIRARRLYCESYEFRPQHKFFMASNFKPQVTEVGTVIWRRIRLIEFNVTIPPDQQDKSLLDKLRGEASGILNWMVQGFLEWQEKGLVAPEKVRQATKEYRDEMDPMGGFLAACCDRGPDLRVGSSDLWTAYQRWCDEQQLPHNDRIKTTKEFGTLLSQKGFKTKKSNGLMVRLGIALKATHESEAARRA